MGETTLNSGQQIIACDLKALSYYSGREFFTMKKHFSLLFHYRKKRYEKNIFRYSCVILMLSLIGCENDALKNSRTDNVENKPDASRKISGFYAGDLSKIDRIFIKSGVTGEAKTITDQERIRQWIARIRDIEVKLDPNQEPKAGYVYLVDIVRRESGEIWIYIRSNRQHLYYGYR